MPYVLTIDQRDSRHSDDAVADALEVLATLPGLAVLAAFERTVGDELQGVLDDGLSVLRCILTVMDLSPWHIGIGVGPMPDPLPVSVRTASGPTFVAARAAVDLAKRRDSVVEIATSRAGTDRAARSDDRADDATAATQLLVDLVTRRSTTGVDAVRLARTGLGQAEIAERLGVTRQAIGQRLAAGRWGLEQRSVPAVARLLERVDQPHRAVAGRVTP